MDSYWVVRLQVYLLLCLQLTCIEYIACIFFNKFFFLPFFLGFSLQWLLLLWSTGSRHVGFSSCGTWALERRLSSCGAWAQLLCGVWDLPGPGLEPVSPALAVGFLPTALPGKPLLHVFFKYYIETNDKEKLN